MPETIEILMLLSVVLLGAVMGSFVNMAASRLPAGGDLVFKKSHCPKCKNNISAIDLVPILSWVMLKGKCRSCGVKIGIRYLLVELALAGFFALVYLDYGLTENSFLLMIASVVVAIIVVVDFEHYIIPDSCQIALLIMGLYSAYSNGRMGDAGYGALLGLSLGLGLRWFYKFALKKDALGLGDVKLLGVSGVWLGWFSFVPYIFYSGMVGVITGVIWTKATGSKIFPFGPALAVSLLLMLYSPQLATVFWDSFKSIGR